MVWIGQKLTTLTVRNAGGPYTSIWIDNNPAPWLTVTGVKSITAERLPLEVTLECKGTGEPGKQYSSNLLIKLENEKTGIFDQASVRIEFFTESESTDGAGEEPQRLNKNSHIGANQGKPGDRQIPQNKMGFSIVAFIVIILAFALLGVTTSYVLNTLFIVNDLFFKIGLIVYAAAAFGFSFSQAITIGSKAEKMRIKNTK